MLFRLGEHGEKDLAQSFWHRLAFPPFIDLLKNLLATFDLPR